MKNYTGKTLEEALQAAAADKNVPVEELTYFVTEEKKGLL
jgi:spoIIIJ-associated protein